MFVVTRTRVEDTEGLGTEVLDFTKHEAPAGAFWEYILRDGGFTVRGGAEFGHYMRLSDGTTLFLNPLTFSYSPFPIEETPYPLCYPQFDSEAWQTIPPLKPEEYEWEVEKANRVLERTSPRGYRIEVVETI